MRKYWNVYKHILLYGVLAFMVCGAIWLYWTICMNRELDSYSPLASTTPEINYQPKQSNELILPGERTQDLEPIDWDDPEAVAAYKEKRHAEMHERIHEELVYRLNNPINLNELADEIGYGRYRHDYKIDILDYAEDPGRYRIISKYSDRLDWVEWPMRIIAIIEIVSAFILITIYSFLVLKKNFGTKLKEFYHNHLKV